MFFMNKMNSLSLNHSGNLYSKEDEVINICVTRLKCGLIPSNESNAKTVMVHIIMRILL